MARKGKKADIYRAELHSGMSCKEIAEKHGVSVQAVYAACGSVKSINFREYEAKDCIWVGLRCWLNEHRMSKRSLLREMGLEYSHCNLERLNQNLKGRNDLRLSFIKKLIEITGMTFEELFREEEHDI